MCYGSLLITLLFMFIRCSVFLQCYADNVFIIEHAEKTDELLHYLEQLFLMDGFQGF